MTPTCLTDLADDQLPEDIATHCPALRPLPVSEPSSTDRDWVRLDAATTAALRGEQSGRP